MEGLKLYSGVATTAKCKPDGYLLSQCRLLGLAARKLEGKEFECRQ